MSQTPSDYEPHKSAEKTFIQDAKPIPTSFDASNFRAALTGYVGSNSSGLKQPLELKELVGEDSKYKFRLQKWTGRYDLHLL